MTELPRRTFLKQIGCVAAALALPVGSLPSQRKKPSGPRIIRDKNFKAPSDENRATVKRKTIYGLQLCWGIPENADQIPIVVPEDTLKVRVRFRNKDFAKAWIKTERSLRCWYLKFHRARLYPAIEVGGNYAV